MITGVLVFLSVVGVVFVQRFYLETVKFGDPITPGHNRDQAVLQQAIQAGISKAAAATAAAQAGSPNLSNSHDTAPL
jgi:hypothetical protein